MKRLFCLGVALFLALEARAQFYAGAGIVSRDGTFEYDTLKFQPEGRAGWKVYSGFHFLRFLAAEASYRDLGHYSYSAPSLQGDLDAKAIDGSIMAHVPVSIFEFFAKAGYARLAWKGDLRLSPIGHPIFDEREWDLLYGAGAEMKVTRGLFVRAEWEQLQASGGVSGFSLGANYRF